MAEEIKRILFCTGEGLGNVTQTIPVLRTLSEVLGYTVDMWHAFGAYKLPKYIPFVDNWYRGNEILRLNPDLYIGKVSTIWTKDFINYYENVKILPLLAPIIQLGFDRSEVDVYMDIARALGVSESKIRWNGGCLYRIQSGSYDVVLHNGYNRYGAANWRVKSYPFYDKVVELLKPYDLKIASIGATEEYIDGTINKTGLKLLDTLGIIRNTSVLVANDCGTYHCANALGVSNIVLFTATSITKNYDYRFHTKSKIITRNLECQPCQHLRRWTKDCNEWKCREIEPELVVESILDIVGVKR